MLDFSRFNLHEPTMGGEDLRAGVCACSAQTVMCSTAEAAAPQTVQNLRDFTAHLQSVRLPVPAREQRLYPVPPQPIHYYTDARMRQMPPTGVTSAGCRLNVQVEAASTS